MFFSCKARKPPSPPPRPNCIFPCCTRGALKCEPRGKGKGAVIYSSYCKDHACRQRLNDQFMCTHPKQPGMSKYCEDHRRCHAEACKNSRVCADSSQDYQYCEKHICFSKSCQNKRCPGSSMCVIHTPLCPIPNCGQPRTDSGLYCSAHSCNDADCDRVISGGSWCKDHRACRNEGCDISRAVTAGGQCEEVCWQHLPTECASAGCSALVSGGVKLCGLHECTYPPCHEPKDDAKDVSRIYCASHTCKHTSCPQPVSDPANPSSARYCITHTCKTPACARPSKPGGAHCPLHACLHPSCSSPRAADPLSTPAVNFCPAHECRAPGCNGPARAEGGYCPATHSCVMPDCASPRTGTGEKDTSSPTSPSSRCASHAAELIAREAAAAAAAEYAFCHQHHHHPPTPPPSVAATRHTTYIGPAEEALGLRLREERERLENAARLERKMRAWEAAAARAAGGGLHVEPAAGRRDRLRSCDSAIGSPVASDDYTFVS